MSLPYCKVLVRSKEGVEVFSVPSERDEESSIQTRASREFLMKGVTSFQSVLPDGSAAFVHRPETGIFKLPLSSNSPQTTMAKPFLKETDRVQIMDVSPKGTYLLTWERAKEGDTPNMKVFDSKTGDLVIGFRQKALNKESWPYVQWTNDETFAFVLGTNEIRVYPGNFPQQESTRFVDKMRVPGCSSMSFPSQATTGPATILFTTFCPPDKNKPARCGLHQYPSKTPVSGNASYPALVSKTLFQAEEMTVHWSPKGDAALVALQTAVDTSGKSYYGSSSLYLMSPQQDDATAVPLPQEGPVLDVEWMPNSTKPPCFAVVAGRMPSLASLHNGNDAKATFLFGNAHRNTIAWAPHGRFLCLAGFGNLAGSVTFWDRNKLKQIPPADPVTASCTVGFVWSPDSRLFCTSTTSPRMNVDNGIHIYRYNGEKMKKLPWNNKDYEPDRLLQAVFLPAATTTYADRPQSPHLKDSSAELSSGPSVAAPKTSGRYVPPSARGQSTGGGGGGRSSGGTSLAERMRTSTDVKLVGAQKVTDKPKLMGVTGKVVVGMAPSEPQGKSKSALRREKAKLKKQEEEERQKLEEKLLAEQKAAEPVDPVKRAKKINKALRQIDELKAKDSSTLNDDQKSKIASEQELRAELQKLGV